MLEKGIKILRLLGLIIFIYCYEHSARFDVPIWVLPMLYTAGMYLCKNNVIVNTPGITIFNFLMFLRYAYAPFTYYCNGCINEMILSYAHLKDALILMSYELVFIFIALEISGRIYANKFSRTLARSKSINVYNFPLNNSVLWLIVVIYILIDIGVTYKSLGQGWIIFLSGQLDELAELDNVLAAGHGYINIIWQSLCVWLYVYFIMLEKKKYDACNGERNVVLPIIYTTLFVLITFIDSVGITRWYTFVSALASFFCITYLFNKHKKFIACVIVPPFMALMVYASLIKNGGYENDAEVAESVESAFGSTNLDAYCSGLGNVNVVFQANDKDVGIGNLVYDALQSMPVVNHSLPKENSTRVAFHKVVERNDQILPMIGQSYMYFGFLLSPLLTIVTIFLFRRFDHCFYFDYSYMKYAYSFCAFLFASVALALNMTIMFMWVYIRVLPFCFILWLTNKFSQKKKILFQE